MNNCVRSQVVLDVLTKKGTHAEKFIAFSHKPRLMHRFRERMDEYRRFWEGIKAMCAQYVAGVGLGPHMNSRHRMYGFLEEAASSSSSLAETTRSEGSATPQNVDRIDSV
jgi:hypothetical protein